MKLTFLPRLLTPLLALFSVSCAFNKTFFRVDWQHAVIAVEIDHESITIPGEHSEIHCLLLKSAQDPIASIFMFHGSGENMYHWAELAEPLVSAGFDVILMDYRGFGKTKGTPTHENAITDATTVLTFFKERLRAQKKFLVGQSYGGQIAIYLAAKGPLAIDGVVVEGTFTSHNDEAVASVPRPIKPLVRVLVRSPYEAIELIEEITVPILIIHSKNDKRVPFNMGKELFERANEPKQFWEISGQHAMGLMLFSETYVDRLTHFFKMPDPG